MIPVYTSNREKQ